MGKNKKNNEENKVTEIESSQKNQQESENTEDNSMSAEDELKLLVEQKDAQLNSYIDKWQRSVAEFDNYRKRTTKEKAEMYDYGASDTITKLLPVIDNFERAVSTIENTDDSFYKGIEMILKQFKEILTSIEVMEIKALGNKFDPNLHNAVLHVEDENYGESEIIEDLQKGYMYKNKVIRPSMVKVAN